MPRQTYSRPHRLGMVQRSSNIVRQLAAHQISIPTPEPVLSYLARHPKLKKLLPEICENVRQEFRPDVEVSLELYRDSEVDDRYLTLYVRMDQYDSQIMERIEAVSQRFNDKLAQVPGYFLLTTDFQLPRGVNAL